jgi:hypothetical protein
VLFIIIDRRSQGNKGEGMEKVLDSDMQTTTAKFPKSLHKELRKIAIDADMTVQDVLIVAVRDWIKARRQAEGEVK